MSIFNLTTQNENLDNKIVAGLERLSQVFKVLLWEKAKEYSLSPIQIQLLIFIHNHTQEKSTVSYLAKEFNVTKPTISDAVRILEAKKMIEKSIDLNDSRSYTILLTEIGKKIVAETEDFPNPISKIISQTSESDKEVIWKSISDLIIGLNKSQVIDIQRTCYNCKYYSQVGSEHFCDLLVMKLEDKDIRIDCPEFHDKSMAY